MKRLTSDNKMLGYELMKAYPNISCFSTTRHGGCSKGNYASFGIGRTRNSASDP